MLEFRIVKWIFGVKITVTAEDVRKFFLRSLQAVPATCSVLYARVITLTTRVTVWIQEGIAIAREADSIMDDYRAARERE